MSGFCPDDWHGTTETDLQQMAAGEDYEAWQSAITSIERSARRIHYAIHDAAIAQAQKQGLVFHTLPLAEQAARMDEAEAARALLNPTPTEER